VLALESHIATLKADIERLTAELAGERAARQADQERHQEQLAAERAARQMTGMRTRQRLSWSSWRGNWRRSRRSNPPHPSRRDEA
jgi:hypothetical protein